MATQSILVIDDEKDLLDLISYNLKREGFKVFTSDNGEEGIQLAETNTPDLILLDIMMPGMDGHAVCRNLRNNKALAQTPIVFLTARGDEESEIKGLEGGADDYLIKPVSNKKLISRVKAVLRRTVPPSEMDSVISTDQLVIDRDRYVVVKNGDEITLPRKEFEILYFLAGNKGKVYSREALLNEIWGDDIYVVDRTVDVHVRKIREKIGSEYIETVKGIGYRFKS